MRSLITLQIQIQLSEARSENGYGFKRLGLKTGVENGRIWRTGRHTPTENINNCRVILSSEYQLIVPP